MATYDNDSSSDSDGEYETTNVILGYASNEPSGDDISHVGGHPVWLDAKVSPPPSLAKCKICNDYMSLLLQLNADLKKYFPNDQRRLQVWSCRKRSCARKPGSIRALREVKKAQTSRSAKPKEFAKPQQDSSVGLGTALFGGSPMSNNSNANPFSTTTSPSAGSANPFSGIVSPSSLAAKPSQSPVSQEQGLPESFAEKLKVGTTPTLTSAVSEPWPEAESFPEPYPFLYLDAYPEELDPTPQPVDNSAVESSKSKYEADDASSSAIDQDTFESTLDKTFQKFSDIVAQNPEQVLRYEFKGHPLLYSGSDGVSSRFVVPQGKAGAVKGIPRCEKCGSQRVFEMQLTPYLIYEIEKDEAIDIDSGMEWGAIIVGTCANNCGEEGGISFREEWVGVQWEERVTRN